LSSLNILTGLFVALAAYFSTKSISYFFQVSTLSQFVGAFSIVFLVAGLGTLRGSLLQKELQFRKIAIIQLFASFSELVLLLILLFQGYHLWSLVIAFLLRFSIQHIAFLICSKYPIRIGTNLKTIGTLIRFGKYDLGAQLLNYFYTNIDNILVGRLLGQTALGYYTLAWEITVKPVSFLNPVILRVAFPMMSKLERVRDFYRDTLKKIALIQTPIYSILAMIMYPLISMVYGQQWTDASGTAVILCGVAVMRSLAEPGASVLAVKGRIDFEFYFQFLNIVVTVVCIILSYRANPSIAGIAMAMLLAHAFLMGYWFWWIWKNLIQRETAASSQDSA
jgi:O-antigen/teichoic acid export membrane protein